MIRKADESIDDSVKAILDIARYTLQEQGTHLPTAILHTMEGLVPVVLPFKDDDQKKALVQYVKHEAVERHAFAVTMVTCARVVDSRTGAAEDCLVLATTVQRGRPHVLVQHFVRDEEANTIELGETIEGEDAVVPGQMMIFPEWEDEMCH